MNISPARRSACVGFTLIELLTVITIISILIGLLLVAIPTAKDMVNRAAARDAAGGIITAVATYYTDYGKYPLGDRKPDPNAPTDILFAMLTRAIRFSSISCATSARTSPRPTSIIREVPSIWPAVSCRTRSLRAMVLPPRTQVR